MLACAPVASTPLRVPSLWRRLACMMYECLLIFGVVFVAIGVSFFAAYLFGTSRPSDTMGNGHALQAFLFVVLGIYFTWFWSHGQTLAMKTWHIRVVDSQGNALTQRRALLRYLWAWLWFLPPLAACAPFAVSSKTAVAANTIVCRPTCTAPSSQN